MTGMSIHSGWGLSSSVVTLQGPRQHQHQAILDGLTVALYDVMTHHGHVVVVNVTPQGKDMDVHTYCWSTPLVHDCILRLRSASAPSNPFQYGNWYITPTVRGSIPYGYLDVQTNVRGSMGYGHYPHSRGIHCVWVYLFSHSWGTLWPWVPALFLISWRTHSAWDYSDLSGDPLCMGLSLSQGTLLAWVSTQNCHGPSTLLTWVFVMVLPPIYNGKL